MKNLLSSITLLLLSALAFGQVPNTFSSGETISSSKINANFLFLADAMARGDIVAIMKCEKEVVISEGNPDYTASSYQLGFPNPTIAFTVCFSTDNQTTFFESNYCSNYQHHDDPDMGYKG